MEINEMMNLRVGGSNDHLISCFSLECLNSDNEDGLFDIALEPIPTPTPTPTPTHHEAAGVGAGAGAGGPGPEEEFEFLVSFVPFPGFSSSATENVPPDHLYALNTAAASDLVPHIQTGHGRSVGCPVVNAAGISTENDQPRDGSRQQPLNKDYWELVPSRKAAAAAASSKVKTAVNGGLRKLLVKFRSISISWSMPPSFVLKFKPPSTTGIGAAHQHNGIRRSDDPHQVMSTQQRPLMKKPFDKWFLQKDRNSNINCQKPRVSSDINLDAISRVLEALSSYKKNIIVARKPKQTKGNPPAASIDTSPIHQRLLPSQTKTLARDNSIQAAIAHCKKSFGTQNRSF